MSATGFPGNGSSSQHTSDIVITNLAAPPPLSVHGKENKGSQDNSVSSMRGFVTIDNDSDNTHSLPSTSLPIHDPSTVYGNIHIHLKHSIGGGSGRGGGGPKPKNANKYFVDDDDDDGDNMLVE